MPPPLDLHPLLIALAEAFARRAGYDPDDVWRWLAREAAPPPSFVTGAVEAFYPLVRPDDFAALPSSANRAKLRDGMQAPAYDRRRKVGRPLAADHPFTRALAAANLTVTEWAFAHGLKRERVKSWFTEGSGGRPIPRAMADAIEAEFGKAKVPATARTWKNGIRE